MKYRFWQYLLYPFSLGYILVTTIRNWLFDHGILLQAKAYKKPIICIGNLTVGGTGKTPMVEFLLQMFAGQYKLAVLSRGYGRKTKGYLAIDERASAITVGDEPFQLYQKFKDKAQFYVCEQRVLGLDRIFETSNTELVLLDDAYQHRYVQAKVNILLSDYGRLFYQDLVLPAGRLRETRSGAQRASMVVVTKCPKDLSQQERDAIMARIAAYTNANTRVFFSEIVYDEVVVVQGALHTSSNMILLSGIANPKPLKEHVASHYHLIKTFEFPDHHNFTAQEILQIAATCRVERDTFLLTTEKDFQRLSPFMPQFEGISLGYLPIKFGFYGKETEIQNLIGGLVK